MTRGACVEGESHLSFRLMAATMSAVQPSLCLALMSAPCDNSLKRDRNIFSLQLSWTQVEIISKERLMANKQVGQISFKLEAFRNYMPHSSISDHLSSTQSFSYLSLFLPWVCPLLLFSQHSEKRMCPPSFNTLTLLSLVQNAPSLPLLLFKFCSYAIWYNRGFWILSWEALTHLVHSSPSCLAENI